MNRILSKIRVLIVDNSAFARRALTKILETDPRIEVVGTAWDGLEAIENIAKLNPDIVTMELNLPHMSGVEAIDIIMREMPLPIIVVSSMNKEIVEETLEALEHGAIDFVAKPTELASNKLFQIEAELINKVLEMATLKKEVSKKQKTPSPPKNHIQQNLVTVKKPEYLQIIEQAVKDGVKSLNLSNKSLTTIPPQIAILVDLKTLHLRNNQLSSLPAEIGQLTNLLELNLGHNQFTKFPAEIAKLTNLTGLDLSQNRLTSLSIEIGTLTHLTYLNLNDNQLSKLPSEINNLKQLKKLYLENNQLTEFPIESGLLGSLTELNLSKNHLTSLPQEIGNWTALTKLYLGNNQLTTLPLEIKQLTKLIELDLRGNALPLPPEILALTAEPSVPTVFYVSRMLDIAEEFGQSVKIRLREL